MLSVFPVKFGAPVADGVGVDAARGALHATATIKAATNRVTKRMAFRMCTSQR